MLPADLKYPEQGRNTVIPNPPLESDLPPFKRDPPSGLRTPTANDKTHILVALVVIVPIILTVLICLITYCIYRRSKSRSNRSSAGPSNVDPSRPPIATIIYNGQHRPFVLEDLPPSYDSLSETKKDPNDSIQLTILPNSNNNAVTAEASPSMIRSTAPMAPPLYSNIDEINQK